MTPEPAVPPPPAGGARRMLRAIFLSADGRTRSGWTLLVFFLVSALLSYGAFALQTVVVMRLGSPGPLWMQTIGAVVTIVTLLVATLVASWAGRQRFREAYFDGFRLWPRLGWGLVGGVGMVSTAVVIALVAGEHAFDTSERAAGEVGSSIVEQLLLLVPAATSEELAVRGLVLQLLVRVFAGLTGWALLLTSLSAVRRAVMGVRVGAVLAVLLTSLVFSVAHAANPNVSPAALANIALVGMVFGTLTVRHGSLWAAVGLHIGWNVCLGIFWGLPISGHDFGLSVLEPTVTGDAFWTGGSFGPEASYVTTAVLAVALAVVFWMPVRRPAEEKTPETAPAVLDSGT